MTKLCPRGKAAAKRKVKVYPSAYANAYASRICAGKIKDPSGVKRKDFKGRKPAAEGGKKVPFFAADGKGAKDLGKAAMKKGGIAKLNPGLKAFMKKKMKNKMSKKKSN